MKWLPYPEDIKETALNQLDVEVFQPDSLHVVMGASGKPQLEVHEQVLQTRGIPLFKRKGGGGTVVLGPGVIVVTVHAGVAHPYRNLSYFKAINACLMKVFQTWRNLPYVHKGISDIALGEKKLVGTSIFRRKQYLLYQASVLVDFDSTIVHQLLKHPPKEPDYRKGRSHKEFMTDLKSIGITSPIEDLVGDLTHSLPKLLPSKLKAASMGDQEI